MLRIGITGAPGSGKSTLARRIVSCVRGAELVSEYARRYISKHGEITSMWEQYRILHKQLEWEDSVKGDILVTDSPVFLGAVYCMELPRITSKDIMCYADVVKTMLKLNHPIPRYDMVLHLSMLPNDIDIDDGVRRKEHLDTSYNKLLDDRTVIVTRDMFPPKRYYNISCVNLKDREEEALYILRRAYNISV